MKMNMVNDRHYRIKIMHSRVLQQNLWPLRCKCMRNPVENRVAIA